MYFFCGDQIFFIKKKGKEQQKPKKRKQKRIKFQRQGVLLLKEDQK